MLSVMLAAIERFAMAIEKLSKSVFIDRTEKVIYTSAFDDDSKNLIEVNKGDGYIVKSASLMPKQHRGGRKTPKKKDFEPTLTAAEKKIYDAALKDNSGTIDVAAYNAAYKAVMKSRENKQNSQAKAE